MKTYKHFTVEAIEQQKNRKTVDYIVVSRSSGDTLAWINYHNHWRQHVFTAVPNTIWSSDCLDDISDCLKKIKKSKGD